MTDSSEKPLVPNYVPDVGRLVTDRFDFQQHVNGTAFRHQANQIDLFPTLVISATTYTNVQDILAALTAIVSPPVITPATNSALGIIQLSGDLAGNNLAGSPRVSGLQGFPISPTVPSPGQVLSWNGSSWAPQTPTATVSLSGDINGTPTGPQYVVGITGSGGVASLHASVLNWDIGLLEVGLSQTTTTSGNGSVMSIIGQSSTVGTGGSVFLVAGGGSVATNNGISALADSSFNSTIQVSQINSARISALNLSSLLDATVMPAGSGDLVTLIGNAIITPTVPSSNGPIIYGVGGTLWVMQSDNTSFQIGSIPNPSVWGAIPAGFLAPSFTGGGFTYTARAAASTSTTSTQQIFAFPIPNNTSVRIDAIIIGRSTISTDSAQFNLSVGYSKLTGSAIVLGSNTSADPRTSGGASSWTPPNIILTGDNIVLVFTGAVNVGSLDINWTASIQLIFAS